MLRPHQKDEIRAAINTTKREMQYLKQGFRWGNLTPAERSNNAKIAIKLRGKSDYIKQLQGRLTGAPRK